MKIKLISIFIIITLSTAHSTDLIRLENLYKYYHQGAYVQTLQLLYKLKIKNENLSIKYYLKGLCFSRLENFGKAIENFSRAIKYKSKAIDIYYEYGQALLALNRPQEALAAFKKSQKVEFKPIVSMYYMGHSLRLINQNKNAAKYFQEVIKSPYSKWNIRQMCFYQLAQIMMDRARKKIHIEVHVENHVIPMLTKALQESPLTPLGNDIKLEIIELTKKFRLKEKKERKKSSKAIYHFRHSINYDTNASKISNTMDSENNPASIVFDSEFFVSRTFKRKRKQKYSPEIRLGHTYHANRTNQNVSQYDKLFLAPSIRTEYKHSFLEKDASFIFDLEYNHTHYSDKFCGPYSTISIGDRITFSKTGRTTWKFKIGSFKPVRSEMERAIYTFFFDQEFFTSSSNALIFLFKTDLERYSDPKYDNQSYLFRLDYIISDSSRWNKHVGMALTFIDTGMQADTRGMESILNPSFKLLRKIMKHSQLGFVIDYQIKTSGDTNYSYSKLISGLEFNHNF